MGLSIKTATLIESLCLGFGWLSALVRKVFFFSWYTNGKVFSEEFFQLALMHPSLIAANDAVATVSALT